MTDSSAPLDPTVVRERLLREIGRVADRLRSLDLGRLDRAGDDGTSPAGRAHAAAQDLADLAARAAGRPGRDVPRLPAHAAGDQVTVTAHDVLAEGADDDLVAALDVLVELRRSL